MGGSEWEGTSMLECVGVGGGRLLEWVGVSGRTSMLECVVVSGRGQVVRVGGSEWEDQYVRVGGSEWEGAGCYPPI